MWKTLLYFHCCIWVILFFFAPRTKNFSSSQLACTTERIFISIPCNPMLVCVRVWVFLCIKTNRAIAFFHIQTLWFQSFYKIHVTRYTMNEPRPWDRMFRMKTKRSLHRLLLNCSVLFILNREHREAQHCYSRWPVCTRRCVFHWNNRCVNKAYFSWSPNIGVLPKTNDKNDPPKIQWNSNAKSVLFVFVWPS